MLGALFVLVLIGIWTLIARLAKQPIDSSTQNEQRMEIDDVQTALAKDGRIAAHGSLATDVLPFPK